MQTTFKVKIRATIQKASEVEADSANQACRLCNWSAIWGCADTLHNQGRLKEAIEQLVAYEVLGIEGTTTTPSGAVEIVL